MTPGTRVAIERQPCATAEHIAADTLTGKTGTVIVATDDRYVLVAVDGTPTPRTFDRKQLEILTTPTPPQDAA